MTYFEAAQEIVNLYADYIESCTANEEGYNDYSESLVVAIEALLIKAQQDKMEALHRDALSVIGGAAVTPNSDSIQNMLGGLKMIVCAAIKYHIHKTNAEVVLCGWRHADVIGQLIGLGFQKQDFTELEQGFIDHTGKFLDRYDAYVHACVCGQLSMTTRENHYGSQLFSEDLY